MSSVERNGVEFDMCPVCRGVWLDRGELEKLMDSTRDERAGTAREAIAQTGSARYERPPARDGDSSHDANWDDRARRKKRGGFDMFDMFD